MTDEQASTPQKKSSSAATIAVLLTVALIVVAVILGTKVNHRNARVAELQTQLTQAQADTAQLQDSLLAAIRACREPESK